MKTILIFSVFIFSLNVFASPCENQWKDEDSHHPILSTCRIELLNSGLELVEIKKGCSVGGERGPCFILRSCGSSKEIGASVFRKSSGASSYCLSGNEVEVFGSNEIDGPKAFIMCNGKNHPKAIRLELSQSKKNCPFPFIDQK